MSCSTLTIATSFAPTPGDDVHLMSVDEKNVIAHPNVDGSSHVPAVAAPYRTDTLLWSLPK